MQHWRAILTAASGSNVSSNVAPTTATVSVTSNWAFKMGLLGFWRFKPIEIFYQELSNSVMGALLIQDVLNPNAAAKTLSIVKLTNPLCIFASNQFHGGVFRAGFRFESMGVVSAAFVLAKRFPSFPQPFIFPTMPSVSRIHIPSGMPSESLPF